MKLNEGKMDRVARIVAGILIFGAGFYFNSWWGLVGLVPFVTGLVGTCPLYQILGLQTCALKK